MQKSEIDVVGMEGFHFPVERFLDFVEVSRPSVIAVLVVNGAEVEFKKHLFSALSDGASERGVNFGVSGAHLEVVDAVFEGFVENGFDVALRNLGESGCADSKHAEVFACISVGEMSLFHDFSWSDRGGQRP